MDSIHGAPFHRGNDVGASVVGAVVVDPAAQIVELHIGGAGGENSIGAETTGFVARLGEER